MTEQSNAEKLRISDGSIVWIIGSTVEETSLLDPLPEGVEVVEQRDDEHDPDLIDAAIVFADDRLQLAEQFDETLPQLGSIPLVWVSWPAGTDVDQQAIQELLSDYGWAAVETVTLDETWSALRIEQS
jgi:hypothetical protein